MNTLVTILAWAALVLWLIVTAVVVYSQVKGGRRKQVQAAGQATSMLRSPWLMALLLVVYAAVMVLLWRPVLPGLSTGARLALAVPGFLLQVLGSTIILWGRYTLGSSHNISSVTGVQLFADHRLVTAGPYRFVRHPMYLGFAVAIIGALLLYATWTVVLIALHGFVFVLRARREEEAMVATFGAEYEAYRRRVPALVPRLW